jgi:ABC-type polysaccharide/polyol phosphate export permease
MRNKSSEGLLEGLSLAWMLAKRDLKNRYANSYAGVAWNVGVPLLYSLINVTVFSILMKGRMGARYSDVPFSLFYFVPFSLWTFFAEVVGRSPGILREYGYLINKIAFPTWVLPLVPLASAFLSQAIILSISMVLMIHLSVHLAGTAVIFLLLWVITLFLTLGFAYGVSALSVYVPDLSQAIPVCITILFWLTPIIYPAALVKDQGALWVRKVIMYYNPFYYLLETSRDAVFGSAAISWAPIGLMSVVAVIVFSAGFFLFNKLKGGFADVI